MATNQARGPAPKKLKTDHDTTTPVASTSTATTIPATPVPTTVATAAATPSTIPTTTTWSTAQIPIDPVLQRQSQAALSQTSQPAALPTTTTQTTQYTIPYPHYTGYNAANPYAPAPTYTASPHYQYQQYHHQQQQQQQQQQQHMQAQAAAQAAQAQAAASAQAARAAQLANQVDTADVSTLNDALGSAGVDLRAEEETLQRSHDHHLSYRPYEDRSKRQASTFAFDTRILGSRMREIGKDHGVEKIPEECVNYLALALKTRLQGLIKPMNKAAQHREEAQFNHKPPLYEDGTPMWTVVVTRDIRKEIDAIEKVAREEEMAYRRERKERADAAAAQAAAAQAAANGTPGEAAHLDDPMDGTTQKKSKKKKDGPGVTARNLSEDVQKRLSNAVATQAAGIGKGKYAWMTSGAANTSTPPPKPKPAKSPTQTTATGTTTPTVGTPGVQSSWAKPYVSSTLKIEEKNEEEDKRRVITLRDALFVVTRERGHGAGRGSAATKAFLY